MRKVLFILQDKKILYNNGKIKEVQRVSDLKDFEIKFARKIINNKTTHDLPAFLQAHRNVKINGLTLYQLFDEVVFHNFILFIDHEKREIELLMDNRKTVKFPYSDLEIIRNFFLEINGMILESIPFRDIELFSYEDMNAIQDTLKKLEGTSILRKVLRFFKQRNE